MPALDTTSALVLGAGTAGPVVIPMLPGSQMVQDSKVRRAPQASNLIASVDYTNGLIQPVVYARCRALSNWFTYVTMNTFFGRVNGYIPGFGPLWFKVAGETAATQFANCKLLQMAVTWGLPDAVLVELWLLPYGGRQNAYTVNLPAPYGPVWLSQSVSYTGWGGVYAGRLTLNNRLAPDVSTPYPPSIDSGWYPKDYYCASLVGNLTMVQKSDAITKDDGNVTHQWLGNVHFWAPGNTKRTTFALSLMGPTKQVGIQGNVQLVTRSWDTIQYSASSSAVAVTGT